MEFPWQKMSIDEFAACERSLGEPVVKVNDLYWKQVRPCFYRPLWPFREHPHGAVTAPRVTFFGGFQHAVPAGEKANSFLNMLVFEDIPGYSMDSLERQKKKQVRAAAKEFVVRPMQDLNEFRQKAYLVYLDFYTRTRYGYRSERRYPGAFSRWADALFQFPKVVILGAYRDGELEAVSISKLVEDTIVYSMVFCNDASLRLNVTGLILHLIREAAAGSPEVKRIFVGMYKYRGRTGVDEFYFTRGCRLVQQPAYVHINPLTALVLRGSMPGQYAKLCGRIEDGLNAHDPQMGATPIPSKAQMNPDAKVDT